MRWSKKSSFSQPLFLSIPNRKQTIASRRYPDDVPDQVKSERVTQLVALHISSVTFNHRLVGQPVEVLIRSDRLKKSQGQWEGCSYVSLVSFARLPPYVRFICLNNALQEGDLLRCHGCTNALLHVQGSWLCRVKITS